MVPKSVTFGVRRYRIKPLVYPRSGPIGEFYELRPVPHQQVILQRLDDGNPGEHWRASIWVESGKFVVLSWGENPRLALKNLREKLSAGMTDVLGVLAA